MDYRKLDRRKFLKGALAVPILGGLAGRANAQTWQPTRNIAMIVPFPPGGQADLAARPVAAALERILGKSVVVDNRSGAGGMLGNAAAVAVQVDGQAREIPAGAVDGEGARFVVNRSGSLSRARQ